MKQPQNDSETTEIGRTEELARDMAYRDFLNHHPNQIDAALDYEEQAWVHYETEALERIVEEDADPGLMSDEEYDRIMCETGGEEDENEAETRAPAEGDGRGGPEPLDR